MVGTIPVLHTYTYALFDPSATHSFILAAFVTKHGILFKLLNMLVCVETPIRDVLVTDYVCKSCVIKIGSKELVADLVVLDMRDFNLILEMDWLATYYASVDCNIEIINFHILDQPKFSFVGSTGIAPP